MNGFEKRALRIKEKIRATTLEMMRISDPAGMRIADIAKNAGVSQVTIYNYFGSKEALVRDVFKGYIDQAVAEFEAFLNDGHTVKEKIAHILSLEKTTYHDFPPGMIRQLVGQDPELRDYIDMLYKERAIPLTVRIIEEGKASGEISAAVSVESVLTMMRLYMGQYETLLEIAQASDHMDELLEGLVHLFFYGICGKP
ncbi:TetR/AcrR family transcriptional regulator [Paenibacillus cymbidii]|uniref:TetR/AcrR family transcriptional regulator n=1 Tax=Paenibacillus cymbidii TaxID=1639034 RepID=UPI0010802948|nr:TetR/AcrR family transcriptional regulator [Paenibacillus cymbidii]